MSDFNGLPWEDIIEITKQDNFKTSIPNKGSLEFVLKEENYPKLVESALKSLQKENPDAGEEQAKELANQMKAFAQKALEEV